MNIKTIFEHRLFRPVAGAMGTVLCGWLLMTPLGSAWVNASYDNLFRFATRPATNKVALLLMDNASHEQLGQERGEGKYWDRTLHAQLLNRLTEDKCPLVVFDVFFWALRDPEADRSLTNAIRRHGNVVLAAGYDDLQLPGMISDQVKPPNEMFLQSGASWGIANVGVEWLGTPREHWPFPSPDDGRPSLSWVAATNVGAKLSQIPEKRWLRYYGETVPWVPLPYCLASDQPSGYFGDKVVFIGRAPKRPSDPNYKEEDKFLTPYTGWGGPAVGGVEILATQFLNLMNEDWLRRPHWAIELLLLLLVGTLSGAGLYYLRPWVGALATLAAMILVTMGTILIYHFANTWIPWLVIVGGQLPFAWVCSLPRRRLPDTVVESGGTAVVEIPYTPDYNRVRKLGEGGFGEVWLVRSAIGQWQALKVVYRKNFQEERHYNFEFEGIKKYKPVSERHAGLLRVELISRKRPEGYYFYVMELGDSLVPGWESDPGLYQADNLWSRCQLSTHRRLMVRECIRIGVVLAEALHCLHESGLTHRDVKPQNVIFVNGQPKLADVGLVTHARTQDTATTQVGTPGYMPPEPEPQGTVQADIYALGMVLYVISTGKAPGLFPELSKTLIERSSNAEFLHLNPIILKACHPDRPERYRTAAELRDSLRDVMARL